MSLLQKAIGSMKDCQGSGGVTPVSQGENAQQAFDQAMRELQQNTAEMIKKAGFNVPQEYANNPQSASMYIIQSGQVGGPIMQRISPLLNRLLGRR